ncbi:unnamed protein product [Porites evermanni]|uniref:G-protein coupled receptors family 1 profile domain-containing protein n=1 Tax=Porites evermanni TaxID=104178 RepID=A0ABN8MPR2_9CNID|nr:unnamed protein product [Porites evermanni]
MNNSSTINNGTQDFPSECLYLPSSPVLQWIKNVVYLFILLLALFGNASVMWIVYKQRRMHTATNYLIVNMAKGFCTLASSFESFLISDMGYCDAPKGNKDMNFVDFGKADLPFLFYSVQLSSAKSRSQKVSDHLHSFIWILHKQWNVDYLIKNAESSKHSPRTFPLKTSSYSTPSNSNTTRLHLQNIFSFDLAPAIYTIVSFVLLYALPLLVIAVSYSIIIAKVWARHIPGNATPANVRLLNKSKKNVLKMLMTVVLAFALCWFLMHLNLFLQDFSDIFGPSGIPVGMQTTRFLFGHANSAINCCIYVIFSQDFRRGFKDLATPFFRKR